MTHVVSLITLGNFKQESNQITFRSCTLKVGIVLCLQHNLRGRASNLNKRKQQKIKGNLMRADFELITLNENFCDLCESPTIEWKVFEHRTISPDVF